MKTILFILFLGFTLFGFSQTTAIPDPNFEQALIDLGYDTPPIDGSVPTNNIWSIIELDVSNKGISDLTGIEDFGALSILNCSLNSLATLDVSDNFELGILDCSNNQLTNLDLPDVIGNALTELYCSSNQLTSLDVSNSPSLSKLFLSQNVLTSLNLNNNPSLEELGCESNQLTSLDLSNNTLLTQIFCDGNEITSLNLTNNLNLTLLWCRFNQLLSIDVSNNPLLQSLRVWNNQLTTLDISNNLNLTNLSAGQNQLTSLDVNSNTLLETIFCYENQLTSIDVSNNPSLVLLWCHSNQLTSLDVRNGNNTNILGIDYFDSRDNPNLTCIYVDNAEYSSQNWPNIDPNSTFVENEAECEALSIGENALELDVFVYPNPTDNYLFIEGNKNPISISIYNLLGAEVISKSNTDKINVGELSKGVYIIRISDGLGQTYRKFIKN